jgi:hypothetical protein
MLFTDVTEMARAAGSVDDTPPLPTHDLKLVWSFLKNGFVGSRFRLHFPHVPEAKDDILPATLLAPPLGQTQQQDIESVTRATLAFLATPKPEPLSPTPFEHSVSFASVSTPRPATPPSAPASPDSITSPVNMRTDAPIVRDQALEPWSWANALVGATRTLMQHWRPRVPQPPPVDAPTPDVRGTLLDTREIGGASWVVALEPAHRE